MKKEIGFRKVWGRYFTIKILENLYNEKHQTERCIHQKKLKRKRIEVKGWIRKWLQREWLWYWLLWGWLPVAIPVQKRLKILLMRLIQLQWLILEIRRKIQIASRRKSMRLWRKISIWNSISNRSAGVPMRKQWSWFYPVEKRWTLYQSWWNRLIPWWMRSRLLTCLNISTNMAIILKNCLVILRKQQISEIMYTVWQQDANGSASHLLLCEKIFWMSVELMYLLSQIIKIWLTFMQLWKKNIQIWSWWQAITVQHRIPNMKWMIHLLMDLVYWWIMVRIRQL